MLEYLKGPIAQVGDSFIVIETGGMGIRITVTGNTTEKLKTAKDDETLKILTHLHITENKWEIFGFANGKEREAFLLLLECRGVGTKAALNILNNFSPSRLQKIALGEEPVTVLQQVPGIGAKSADRILVELKEKLPEMSGWSSSKDDRKKYSVQYVQDDLYRALKNLGYRTAEIQSAIAHTPDLPTNISEAVRQLLKALGKR